MKLIAKLPVRNLTEKVFLVGFLTVMMLIAVLRDANAQGSLKTYYPRSIYLYGGIGVGGQGFAGHVTANLQTAASALLTIGYCATSRVSIFQSSGSVASGTIYATYGQLKRLGWGVRTLGNRTKLHLDRTYPRANIISMEPKYQKIYVGLSH